MMYILHIDTSADASTVMLSADTNVISELCNNETKNHAAAINIMIEQALSNAGITMRQLDAVAVCSGPGSYTGLRIAMGTAKGICYALGLPLLAHNKLLLLSLAHKEREATGYPIATILVAREKEYFMAVYDNKMKEIIAPKHILESEMTEILQSHENLHIVSNLSKDNFYQLKVNFSAFDPNITLDLQSWARHSAITFNRKEFADIAMITPTYLKQVYTHK